MRIAMVGCGWVADMYMHSMHLHPGEVQLVGVADRDTARAARFASYHGLRQYASVDELLADPQVEMVLNLTNPRSHYEVTKRCLEAGKHVYCEKPLAMRLGEARDLVALAEARGLRLAGAPCSHLCECAQTMGKALRDGIVGPVRAVYAEMDDGLVHRMPHQTWRTNSGNPWNAKDEFEVGCTLEHAGYVLTWLCAFFGPAKSVTAFASVQIPDKGTDVSPGAMAPDLSVACVQFENGVVARLTCSIIAHHDHHFRVYGDDGVLWTPESWHYRAPVYVRKLIRVRRRLMLHPLRRRLKTLGAHLPQPKYRGASQMDFTRGPAELAAAVREGRRSRVPADFSLHVTEMALAIHNARDNPCTYTMTSRFEPLAPMPWAV
jgi:predicted dehydrogenase